MKKLTTNQLSLLAAHAASAERLADEKKNEMALRIQIAETIFDDAKLGVNKAELPNGFVCNFTKKETKRTEQDVLISVLDQLSVSAANRGIKITYSINWKALEFLSNEDVDLLLSAVTTVPGKPTISIKQPKI